MNDSAHRPSRPDPASQADLDRLPKPRLFRLAEMFGSWADAQAKHFAAGGVFDGMVRAGR